MRASYAGCVRVVRGSAYNGARTGPTTRRLPPRIIGGRETTPAARGAARRIWAGTGRVERAAYTVAALLVISGLAHLAVLAATGGTWQGPLSLRKPTTFGLSFGLTLATVVWATSHVPVRTRARSVLLVVFAAACVLETALVTLQAWRGVPSHFNYETGFDTAVSMVLAGGGGVIVLTVLAFTAAALNGAGASAPSMRLAARYGFVVLLLSMAVGGMMIASGVVEARTGDPQVAYATAGGLKPLHGVAMHAVLVIPGLAWLLGRGAGSERRRVRIVGAAAAPYTVLLVAAAAVSVLGTASTGPVIVASGASAVALAVLAAAGTVALRGVVRASSKRDRRAEGGGPDQAPTRRVNWPGARTR